MLLATLLVGAPERAHAETCSFSVNLELGYQGEEVRCLQRYLNSTGFVVATEGVGSPGQETSLYREKTADAVRRWQIAYSVSPATGTFGPLSQAKYLSLVGTSAPAPTTPTVPSVPTPTPTTPAPSSAERNARAAIEDAIDAYQDAVREVEDAEDDDEEIGKAKNFLTSAQSNLLEAFYLYFDGDYADVIDDAEDAEGLAQDAVDELSGGEEGKAEEALDEADEMISDAWEDVEKADDDGEDIDDAEDYLEDAEDELEEARELFDEEEYDEVMEKFETIEELVEEALDSID